MGNNTQEKLKTKLYDIPIIFSHIKMENGGFLTIAASRKISEPIKIYSMRWEIETAFKACKTNGFRVEDSRIKSNKRFNNLIKILFMSFAIATKTGIIKHLVKPIPIKQSLRFRAYSFTKYGLILIKEIFSSSKTEFNKFFSFLNQAYSKPPPIFVQ